MYEINRRRSNPRWNITEDLAGYMFMMPIILVLGTFVVLPIFYAVFLSLQKVQLLGGYEHLVNCTVFHGDLSGGVARYTPNTL